MKSNLVSFIITFFLFVNTGYAQESPFEGTIRMAVSLDFDQWTKSLTDTGNKWYDQITKKYLEGPGGSGLTEALSNFHGKYEFVMLVKGNKCALFNSQDGSVLIVDCDKGEISITIPYAKLCRKYTVTEYQQLSASIAYDITILNDSIENLAGYQCRKVIKSGNINGKVAIYAENWYTDKITLPSCYLETFHDEGLNIVSEIKVMGSPIYTLVTEINRIEVSDENFVVPKDYETFTNLDYLQFNEKLVEAAKNKKTYTVGSKIPEVFWDY